MQPESSTLERDDAGGCGRLPQPSPRAALVAQRMAPRRSLRGAALPTGATRLGLLTVTLALAAGPIWAMQAALGGAWGLREAAVFGLFAVGVGWTAAAAGVALLGLMPERRVADPVPGWRPRSRTAVLVLTCGEPPLPVVGRVRALHRDLAAAGLGEHTEIFVLSDTQGPAARAEAHAFAALDALPGVWWRQRPAPVGRKPGNLVDWLEGWGGRADHMLVLDADSRMCAARIAGLIHRMEADPGIGLVQSGMRLVPARTRFGALQRLSARLCGPGFARGLAAWTGTEGNSWGHNVLIRTEAFAEVARLPVLPGRPPFGGAILSHDFVEAAFLRRAGWAVVIEPDGRGSFEDAPQRLCEFHRRDRRWCQGNLQHMRLLAAPGLHLASRLHLFCGILGYVAAPLWLGLVLLIALSRPDLATLWPVLGALTLLLVPKLAAMGQWLARLRGRRRRRVVLRAAAVELGLSTLLAPLMLLRQSLAVASVLAGRDSGWVPAGGAGSAVPAPAPASLAGAAAQPGRVEAAAGLTLLALIAPGASALQLALLLPVLGPLLAAPWLVRALERPTRRAARGLAFAPSRPAAGASSRAAA